MNSTTNQGTFNPFGLGAFNGQSGFSNWNDAADSIGSIFGLGPEDRGSVTARGQRDLEAFAKDIFEKVPTIGYDSAIQLVTDKITAEKGFRRTMKSANSKHLAQMWIDNLPKLITSLNKQKNEPTIADSIGAQIKNGSVAPSNTMFLGFGVLILLLTKFTNILK
jgi:hypothetical protein